jgi:hypothetical protein
MSIKFQHGTGVRFLKSFRNPCMDSTASTWNKESSKGSGARMPEIHA